MVGFYWRHLPFAPNFSIDWFTIDGGGGTSTRRRLFGQRTIGQPDAAT